MDVHARWIMLESIRFFYIWILFVLQAQPFHIDIWIMHMLHMLSLESEISQIFEKSIPLFRGQSRSMTIKFAFKFVVIRDVAFLPFLTGNFLLRTLFIGNTV